MRLERIKWRQSDHDCRCVGCNGAQAVYIAHTGGELPQNVPVCESCSELPEETLIKQITGGE